MLTSNLGNGKWGDVRRDLEGQLKHWEVEVTKAEKKRDEVLEQLKHLDVAIDTLNKMPDNLVEMLLGRIKPQARLLDSLSTPKTRKRSTKAAISESLYESVLGLMSKDKGSTAREMSHVLDKDYSSITIALRRLESEGRARWTRPEKMGPYVWYLV